MSVDSRKLDSWTDYALYTPLFALNFKGPHPSRLYRYQGNYIFRRRRNRSPEDRGLAPIGFTIDQDGFPRTKTSLFVVVVTAVAARYYTSLQ